MSPRLKKEEGPDGVLAILIHEVCHAVTPGERHGPVFRKCALAVGLEGKMTETTASKELCKRIKVWFKTLGSYPHALLRPGFRPEKKQTTRMVLCKCNACGYQCRTSRKWLEAKGAPLCPCNDEPMGFKIPDELVGEKDED